MEKKKNENIFIFQNLHWGLPRGRNQQSSRLLTRCFLTQEGFHLIHNEQEGRRSISNICRSLTGQGSVQILEKRIKTKSVMKKQGEVTLWGSPFDLLWREFDQDLWHIKERVGWDKQSSQQSWSSRGTQNPGNLHQGLFYMAWTWVSRVISALHIGYPGILSGSWITHPGCARQLEAIWVLSFSTFDQ